MCLFVQGVGFLWGYYIQQFGATIIILAAGFIVSCVVSNYKKETNKLTNTGTVNVFASLNLSTFRI